MFPVACKVECCPSPKQYNLKPGYTVIPNILQDRLSCTDVLFCFCIRYCMIGTFWPLHYAWIMKLFRFQQKKLVRSVMVINFSRSQHVAQNIFASD